MSDGYVTNGNTPEGIKAQIDDIRAKAPASEHSMKTGVNAFFTVEALHAKESRRAVYKRDSIFRKEI